MSRKKYILQIQNPCEEKWSEMTPNEAGRFCAHCEKTVVDFTKMTDHQIVQLVENLSGKMCGRLMDGQMNRVITDNTENDFYRFPRLVAGLLLAGTATNSIAQANEVKTEIVTSQNSEDTTQHKTLNSELPKIDSTKNFIQGKVLDENKEGVIQAIVVVVDEKGNNTRVGTQTDFDGNFKLYIPDKLIDNASTQIRLKITCIGCEPLFETIYKNELPVEKRTFAPNIFVTMGMVVVDTIYKKPQKQNKQK